MNIIFMNFLGMNQFSFLHACWLIPTKMIIMRYTNVMLLFATNNLKNSVLYRWWKLVSFNVGKLTLQFMFQCVFCKSVSLYKSLLRNTSNTFISFYAPYHVFGNSIMHFQLTYGLVTFSSFSTQVQFIWIKKVVCILIVMRNI